MADPGPQGPAADLELKDKEKAGPGSEGLRVSGVLVDPGAWPRKVAQGFLARVLGPAVSSPPTPPFAPPVNPCTAVL